MGMDRGNQESQELLLNDEERFFYEYQRHETDSSSPSESPTRVRASVKDSDESAF